MTHDEAIAYLDMLEILGIRPGLERIRTLLGRLGDPQATFPSVLIGGTNGKGSVAAFTASILWRAGHTPGVYTSPHLVRFEERISVGGEAIPPAEIAALVPALRDAVASDRLLRNDPPTYFEATTALAFLHFSRKRVPIAVLEVGMGGRFDATNVVRPLASAITPVAIDHTRWLGRTLGEIAYQKAGILKDGVPTVVSRQEGAALDVIRAEAARVGAPLVLTTEARVTPAEGGARRSPGRFPDPPAFSLVSPSGQRYPSLSLSLRGVHQVENAVTAVLLAERLAAAGIAGVGADAMAQGLRTAAWPGRIEIVPGRPDILLDGAHNPAGCAALAAYLKEYQPSRPMVLVFSVMRDKPAAAMLDILAPLFRKVIVTRIPGARGASAEALYDLAARRHPDVARTDSVGHALPLAREAAGGPGLVVVSGSLYLVGEAKKQFPG